MLDLFTEQEQLEGIVQDEETLVAEHNSVRDGGLDVVWNTDYGVVWEVPEHDQAVLRGRQQGVLWEVQIRDFWTLVAVETQFHAVDAVVGVVDVEHLC